MGRRTYASIGHPLPERDNIIITSNAELELDGVTVAKSLDDALLLAGKVDEVMIIGGARVYQQAMAFANRLYLTILHADVEGDAYFPEWNDKEWKEKSREEHTADEANAFDYSFVTLAKR